jgi:hypothetical protein
MAWSPEFSRDLSTGGTAGIKFAEKDYKKIPAEGGA